jgi:adenosine deaminase
MDWTRLPKADFLLRAPRSYTLMQTEEQLRLVTLDLFERLGRDNVLYAEIRFAPRHTVLSILRGFVQHFF